MEQFHEIMMSTAISLSFGITGGAIGGAVARRRLAKRRGTQPAKPQDKGSRYLGLVNTLFRFFAKSIYWVLSIALIWTAYFLVVGLVDTEMNAYATNAVQLIVGVVTVFSIMIAFYEFMHRGKEK